MTTPLIDQAIQCAWQRYTDACQKAYDHRNRCMNAVLMIKHENGEHCTICDDLDALRDQALDEWAEMI